MGKFSDWMEKRLGFSNPAKDLERIVGCINRIAIDAEHLDKRPTYAVQLSEIEALQQEAVKFRKNLTAALALNPRYRPLASSAGISWRLHAARDKLTAAEVRLEAIRGRIHADSAADDARKAAEASAVERRSKRAKSSWEWLDKIKNETLQERRDNPDGTRADFIRERLDAIRAQAKAAGKGLSGDNASLFETVERWFREAGIK